MQYAELHCKTNFSFLEGASHPDELVVRAKELGYAALAVTDRESLAGVVRAHTAAKEAGVKLIIGAEVHPVDAPPAVLWATDRRSYGRLSRLLTIGRRRAEKGKCELRLADVAEFAEGLVAGVRSQESEGERQGDKETRRQGDSSGFKVQGSKLESSKGDCESEVLSPEHSVLSTQDEQIANKQRNIRLYQPAPDPRRLRAKALAAYADIFRGRCYVLGELFRGA